MNPRNALLLALTLLPLSCANEPAAEAPPAADAAKALASEDDKTLYALGTVMGRNAKALELEPRQLAIVMRGFEAAASGGTLEIDPDEYAPRIQAFINARVQVAGEAERSRSQVFLEQAARGQGAVRTDSGLVIRTLKPGTGAHPGRTDTVEVHYVGTLTDGTEFDSSRKRGEPVRFQLDQVVPCWTEGVQRMQVGETAQLVCPSDIAYGDRGRPPLIKPGATLVFEVELLGIGG